MERLKKVFTLGILICSVFIFTACKNEETKKPLTELTGFEFQEKMENKDSFILVIYRTGCSHCEEYMPIFEQIMGQYDFEAYKINTAGLTSEELGYLQSFVTISGTPTTVFFKDGEETSSNDRIVGNQPKSKVVKKLKKMGYIGD